MIRKKEIQMKFPCRVLFVLLGLLSSDVSAQKILYTQDEHLGIRVPDVSLNRWQSREMEPDLQPSPADYQDLKEDFFLLEYGVPLTFKTDLLKEFGARVKGAYQIRNGALEFQVPKKGWSMLFGAKFGENNVISVRFGRGWGPYAECPFRMILELEQNADESNWQFIRHQATSGKQVTEFKVKGKQLQTMKIPLGMINQTPYSTIGVELACLTESAKVRIRSIRIVPFQQNVFWRRRFMLDFEPVRAGVSCAPKRIFTLHVNGKKAAEGSRILSSSHGVLRTDILRYLHKGENEILFRVNTNGGYSPSRRFAQEAFVIGENGEKLLLPGDKHWEWSYDGKTWRRPVLHGRIGMEVQPNGKAIASGSIPLHAGALDVRLKNEPYPVFDYNGTIEYEVAVPAGIRSPEVSLTLRDSRTGRVYEKLSVSENTKQGKLRTFTVAPKLRRVGAYTAYWELRSAGKQVDQDRSELIICGPLKLDEFAYPAIEQELEKRLVKVHHIDCTKNYGPEEFVDHSSHFGKPKLNLSRVVTKNGMTYRETGDSSSDFFAYKINVGTLGTAHIAEIIIPDNATRTLYSSVNETYPLRFANNFYPIGSRGWPNASGSVRTGGLMPLSFGKKTLRYVFFPGSRNITINVEKGQDGDRAAAIEINIYEVKGGLPALKLPKTNRLYANHNERVLFSNWGTFLYPKVQEASQDLFESLWSAAFYGVANRISFLKFAGHNASVEGSLMYSACFPSKRGHTTNPFTDFDYFYLMLKLYKHNRIRTLVGFEYMRSMQLTTQNRYSIGEREMIAGTARPVHNVDRYGKQTIGYGGMGLNYLNPVVWNSILDVLDEIYQRYEKIGGIEGLFMINGQWWLPGFTVPNNRTADEIGYDDDSIEAFERETKIRLNLPFTGKERFAKRYELLNKKYNKEWYRWRSTKMRSKIEELAKVIRSGENTWKLFVVPTINYPEVHPFNRMDATARERDSYHETLMKHNAFDPAFYRSNEQIVLVPKVNYDRELRMALYGSITNRGSRKLYTRNNAVYLAPAGLNERKVKATAAKEWWWKDTGINVYDVKQAGEYAFFDVVDVLSGHAPKYLFHTWLDVNCTTAHTGEARRLLSAFYATPELSFTPFAAIHGVQAGSAENFVQLINDTPYPVSGTLTFRTPGRNEVTGESLRNTVRCEIRPFGVMVLRVENPTKNLSGSFTFQKEIADLLSGQARTILEKPVLRRRIAPEFLQKLSDAYERKDLYGMSTILRDFEVLQAASRFFASAPYLKNQNRLLEMLRKEKTIRINCGSTTDYRDEKGKLWLPDQPYMGFDSYGNEYATYVYRGPIEIAKTSTPEIYRYEAYGVHLYYHIPLPAGEYRVKLLVAETWDKHPGRKIQAVIGGQQKTISPWDLAGGRCAASVTTWESVAPRNGIITIDLSGNPIINGIVIEQKKAGEAAAKAVASPQNKPVIDLRIDKAFQADVRNQKLNNLSVTVNQATVNQEGNLRYLTLQASNTVYLYAPRRFNGGCRTLMALVRNRGGSGEFVCHESVYRFDFVSRGEKMVANLTVFPPKKGHYQIRYPKLKHFDTNQWHHIAFTVDPSGEGAIYVDGELQASGPLKALHNVQLPASRNTLAIANWDMKKRLPEFRSDVARIAYYDTLLPSTEIRSLAAQWLAEIQ